MMIAFVFYSVFYEVKILLRDWVNNFFIHKCRWHNCQKCCMHSIIKK